MSLTTLILYAQKNVSKPVLQQDLLQIYEQIRIASEPQEIPVQPYGIPLSGDITVPSGYGIIVPNYFSLTGTLEIGQGAIFEIS